MSSYFLGRDFLIGIFPNLSDECFLEGDAVALVNMCPYF